MVEQPSGTAASLLLTDRGLGSLTRVNLATGVRTTVSDEPGGVGSGPALRSAADVALDTRASANGHSALVMLDSPSFQLIAVDLVTGDRTPVASLNSSAPAVNHVNHLRLDVKGNRVLFTEAQYNGNNALYAIHLATGVR